MVFLASRSLLTSQRDIEIDPSEEVDKCQWLEMQPNPAPCFTKSIVKETMASGNGYELQQPRRVY